jgi:hypothetical protein
MKRLLAAIAFTLAVASSFGATLSSIQSLQPAGSTSGQFITSTGPTTPPAWTSVTLSGLGGLAAANNLSDVASVSTARTNLGAAPLASPTFTGTPSAPTPAQFDNSGKVATSAFVQRALGSYSGVAGFNSNTTLTLAQVGNAIDWFGPSGGVLTLPSGGTIPAGNAITFYNYGAGTLIVQIAGGSDFIYSGTVTTTTSITLQKGDNLVLVGRGSNEIDVVGGTASLQFYSTLGVTPAPGDNSTKLATTAFAATSYAPLASPTLTGTPLAPTAAAATNTTQIATTAFTTTAVANALPIGWTAYTPTLTASAGTYTTASVTGAYSRMGKLACIRITATITTVGTGTTSVVSLPVAAATTNSDMQVLAGRENGVSGKMLQAFIAAGSSTITITDYLNSSPAANGAVQVVSGCYISA